jgi:hypothetical protein
LHTASGALCTGKTESERQNKTIQAIENGARTRHLQRLIVAVIPAFARLELGFNRVWSHGNATSAMRLGQEGSLN